MRRFYTVPRRRRIAPSGLFSVPTPPARIHAARIDIEVTPARPRTPLVDATAPPTPAGPSGLVVEQLTRRETTILELLASHLSLPEIGLELHISRHTVKSHVRRIYRKLGATSRSGAVTAARELGILAR